MLMKREKNNMGIMQNSRGFSLIEVLLGISIFMIGMLGVTALNISSLKSNTFSGNLSEATLLAATKIEELMATDFDDIVDGGADGTNQDVDDDGMDDDDPDDAAANIDNKPNFGLDDIGADAVQIFARVPRNKKSETTKFSDIARFNKVRGGIKFFTHSAYGINFTQAKIDHDSVMSVVRDLKFCERVGGIGTVVHLGSSTRAWSDIRVSFIAHLRAVAAKSVGAIILENQAKAGNKVLITIRDIVELWGDMPPELRDRVGFCIDTCHRFVTCSMMGIKTDLLRDLKALVVRKIPIYVVHLNDSASRTQDRHANPFEGLMDPATLVGAITICHKNNIPMIIERWNIRDKSTGKQLSTDKKKVKWRRMIDSVNKFID